MEKKDNNKSQVDASNKSILLLESIKKAIEFYNNLNPEDKLIICREQDYKSINNINGINIANDVNDVSNVCVCTYYNSRFSNKLIGLFNRNTIQTMVHNLIFDDEIRDHIVYKGIKSEYIGIRNLSYNEYCSIGSAMEDINNKLYTANCEITNEMSFDDLRSIMYSEGLIGPYQIGKATDEEMLEELKYARSYFRIEKPAQKRK